MNLQCDMKILPLHSVIYYLNFISWHKMPVNRSRNIDFHEKKYFLYLLCTLQYFMFINIKTKTINFCENFSSLMRFQMFVILVQSNIFFISETNWLTKKSIGNPESGVSFSKIG